MSSGERISTQSVKQQSLSTLTQQRERNAVKPDTLNNLVSAMERGEYRIRSSTGVSGSHRKFWSYSIVSIAISTVLSFCGKPRT
jgi:hypothetical protein